MRINAVNSFNLKRYKNPKANASVGFRAKENLKTIGHDPENPISKTMERLDLMKGAIVAGLGFGARALFEFADDETFSRIFNTGQNIANRKFANLSRGMRTGLGIASACAIVIGAIGIIGGIYALTQTPKAIYQGGINAHKKSEEMDVYLGQNKIEQDLYKQVTEKAKEASTKEDLQHVQEQYFLLKKAKAQIPAFMNNM